MTAPATVPELHRIALKLFVREEGRVELGKAVPVFHRWIQEHRLPGILVDVTDYSHLPQSPGVVLVSHEANLALDRTEGPLGLLYTRKTALPGTLPDRLRSVLRIAIEACLRLEKEPEFAGSLSFGGEELLFLSNDRLSHPNSEEAFASVRPALESVLGDGAAGGPALEREFTDPRRRLAIRARFRNPPGLAALLARLG